MSLCRDCKRNCRPSFVYIMSGRADGCVKVGYAASTAGRVAGLRKQFGQPEIRVHRKFEMKCELQATLVEGLAHDILDPARADGEWFLCSPETAETAIRKAINREAKQ